jgi:hypothetical protein
MTTSMQRAFSIGRLGSLGSLGSLGMAAALGMAACFIEPAPPSSFRFECSADVECDATQRCANGLCQQPCGGDDDVDCAQEAPVCLNGYCSSVCTVADELCSSPQTCVSLSFPGEAPAETGVCVVPCGDDAPCPASQLCYDALGLCVATCMANEDCASGEECLSGFCVPSSSGRGG